MTKVKFLVDFRGKLTREIFYLAGSVAEFDSDTAGRLLAEGWAVAVEPEKTEPTEVTEPTDEPEVLAGPAVNKRRKVKKA